MGGTIMIRNIIILSLLAVIVLDMSSADFLNMVSGGLDKIQQLVYTIRSEVN